MKVVIATPLYPPDIAQPGPYVKELAKRLAAEHHITIVAYGHLPEPVDGVDILSVEKKSSLPLRLSAYLVSLFLAIRGADVLYVENGASTELPAALVSLVAHVPLILHLGDKAAHVAAKKSSLRRAIENFASRRAERVIDHMPHERPEIIPFVGPDVVRQDAYEASWREHLALVGTAINHG
jgi:hypothetical protein